MKSLKISAWFAGRYAALLPPFLLILLPGFAHAAWTDVGPPSGAVFNYALAPSAPATVFTTNTGADGTQFGVWRSTNSGASWTQVNNSATYNGAAVKPDTAAVVLAGIQGGAVERSATSGNIGTWAATTASGTTQAWVFGFSASSPNTVYAGGASAPGAGYFQKSTDGGATWSPLTVDADSSPAVRSIAVDPTNPNIVYAGVQPDGGLNDGLYKSTNGGASWTLLVNLDFTTLVDALVIDPNDINILYAGTSGFDEIWRSTDSGATWTEILDASASGFTNFNLRGIDIDPDDSRVIYAAGGSGAKVLASSNCGATWTDVTSTGITGSPSNVRIDTANNFVYVVENILFGTLYRETLGNGLPAASGTCPGGSPPGNNPPVAVDDAITATEDTSFVSVTDLDANDSDPDTDPLTVVAGTFSTLQGGSITIATDGSYTYTPAANFTGSDSVNYTVTDGSASDSGTLNITVDPVDDPPVAVDDAISVVVDPVFSGFISTVDLDANDIEVDGESLSVTSGTFATTQGGSITIAANGSYSYMPPLGFTGSDSYVYTVTDGITPDNGTLNITVSVIDDSANVSGDDGGSSGGGSGGSSPGGLLMAALLGLLLIRVNWFRKLRK